MQELIEQVKRLAEAQKATDVAHADYERGVDGPGAARLYGIHEQAFNERNDVMDATDFPALLAHMQAQQAVVDAAKKARRQDDLSVNPPEHALVTDAAFDDWFQQRCVDHEKAYAALDAALEKVKDHEQ